MKQVIPSSQYLELVKQIAKDAQEEDPEVVIWDIPDSPVSGLVAVRKTIDRTTYARVLRIEGNQIVGRYEVETRPGFSE